MEKDLTEFEIVTLYKRIVKDGVYELEGIKTFEIRQVFQYADKINMDAVRWCVKLLENNQNFNYPPEYPENKQLEYWLKESSQYGESNYVKELLNQKFKEIKSISKDDKSKLPKGIQSSLTDVQIERIFKKLKGKFIDLETDEDNFKSIFKNETLPNNCIIIWLGKINNLAYLFWRLRKLDLIESRNLGLTLSLVFTNLAGTNFKNNILNKNFSDFENDNGFPADASTIDIIITNSVFK